MLATLIPVIVGGVIGLLGGLVGPPLAHWLGEKSAKKKKRAEKLEELMGALYAYAHWLETIRGIRMWSSEIPEPPSPMPQAQAIAAIYFPHLSARLDELERIARNYELWMLEAGSARLEGKLNIPESGFRDAYDPFWKDFSDVIDELRRFGKVEFGAPNYTPPPLAQPVVAPDQRPS